APTLADRPRDQAGDMFGRYKLLQQIGEGGFGVVYMAEQREPVRRRVALKIIKLGMDSRQVIARFEAERQALAMMDHPNVAKVLDAGSTNTGRLYFVMEYIKGVPILEYCDTVKLDIRARLELFTSVCHALQHAHQKGIIHRDIKPGNVLVTMHDGVPVPKVIDFGIAKATRAELTAKTLFTEHRQMIGTPAYMSPEQAEMSGLDIDTRSDIYSLGVLLYELLTGTTPFDATELMSKGFAEMMRIIREVEPHKPSTRLSRLGDTGPRTAQQRRAVDPRKLSRTLKGDLDWIIMKCLEKDRRRRYETANELAMDIRRHLDGEAVVAAPPSAAYRLRKFIRRNRVPVTAGGVVVATLVTGIVGTTIGFIQAHSAQIDADRNAEDALREKAAAQRQAYSASMLGASDALERWQLDVARHYLDSAPPDLRGWEWRHLSSRLDPSLRVHDHKTRITQLHVAPDGGSYYGVGPDPARTVQRWDIETGRLLQTIPIDRECFRSWLVGDGTRLVMHFTDTPGSSGTVEVWDMEQGARLSSWPIVGYIQPSTDGSLVAYTLQDKICLMDLRTGAVRTSPANPPGAAPSWGLNLCFQPDGRRMAVEWAVGRIRLVDVDSLQVLSTFEAHDNVIWAMAFSPDATRLASASSDGTVRITDVAANPPVALATLRGHRGTILDVSFSPDGSLVASRGQDRTVRLWDVRTGSAVEVFQTAGDEAGPTAFLPDGQTLIAADDDGAVHFWDVRSADAWAVRGHRSYVYPVLLSPDGATVYSGGWDGFAGQPGCLRIWDAASGEEIAATGAADTIIVAAALSSDGSRLALSSVAADSARIEVIDTATGARVASIPESEIQGPNRDLPRHEWAHVVTSLAFDPRGRRFAWINDRGLVVISKTRTGATLMSRPTLKETETGAGARLAWSPDGATIATCHGVIGTLGLWDGNTLEPVREWPLGHEGMAGSLAFSPDSRRIVTAGEHGVARVWNVATGTLVHELTGQANQVHCAAYSPDGQRIATGGNDNDIWLWDAHTFDPVARLVGHENYVYSLAWRADSQLLVSGSGDHTVRIWETQALKDRMQARRERQDIVARVEPLVQRLFDELGDAARVVEEVKADTSLREPARQVALQLVLAAAIKARSSTPASSSPASVGTSAAASSADAATPPPTR
ncbi:MAG: protein kinase domain-containing protein, partial [Planctomycetota bacterium]